MSTTYLAIDAGKTETRAAVITEGTRGPTVTTSGLENVASVGGLDAIRGVLHDLLGQVPAARPFDGVCLGLTGVLTPDRHADRVLGCLEEVVVARRLVVTSDAVTSYCGALGSSVGAVVAAGTGTIALALGPDGEVVRVDGWGFLLDDAGSAFAIGRSGLRAALRTSDGREQAHALQRIARARFGEVGAIVDAVYGAANPPRTVASFAPEVTALAATGDPVAVEIVEGAATALATTVAAAAGRVFGDQQPVPVSWCGGVFEAGSVIQDPFARALTDRLAGVELVPPAGDALDGAALLAAGEGPAALDPLLLVAERSLA